MVEDNTQQHVAALVDQCLHGDEKAMTALIERFQSMVFGLCLRMLGHRQDAEDVTQETFVRVFRSLARWDSTREFTPWLLAIAGNRCRSWLSLRKNRAKASELVEDLPDATPDVHPARQLAEEIDLALGQVRDDYRKAFLLFHENELSYAEISEILGCPVGTVKTWIHRARREVVEHLRRRGVVDEVSR